MLRRLPLLLLIVCACWPLTGRAGHDRQPGHRDNAPVSLARSEMTALIMVDDPACHYCRRWHKEVGGGYSRTAEGRAAPLKRVGRDAKILSEFAPVVYTPTFILVRGGREVGRITGYPGQLYFWEELSQLMTTAGIKAKG